MAPPLALFLLVFFFLHQSARSQEPNPYPCDDTFSFYGTPIAAEANLTHCRKLSALDAELGWNLHNATNATNATGTTVDIVFSAAPLGISGWIAWGVNPGPKPMMVGTRALVGIRRVDNGAGAVGPPVVATYNVTAEVKLGCGLRNSSVELVVENVRSNYSAATGRMVMAARVRLPPAYNVSRLNNVWQVGPAVVGMMLVPHPQRLQNFDGVETLDLVTGRRVGGSNTDLRDAHGILSVIGWGIILPIGVITVRYFKTFPFRRQEWFILHSTCQICAYVVGITAWGIGFALLGGSRYYNTIMGHRIIGILVFWLANLQMMALWLKPTRHDKYRKYWSIYHHFVGYSLLALTIVNIFKGFKILQPPPKWRAVYVGILISIGCATLVLEGITWYKFWQEQKEEKEKKEKQKMEKDRMGKEKMDGGNPGE
ncbi:hypothetical protein KSP40_PGU006309 [Platanthera guangdongensis]|uniref:Cytochrome b561 and DOMON domain-containing protein n=1 Tax=Platanthera guangdongensis TaxID=2320717 RepID=A0ABR2N3N3_9ASPA